MSNIKTLKRKTKADYPPVRYGKKIHIDNCCKIHGCKFGSTKCPVVLGTVKQKHKCALCKTKIIQYERKN